MSGIDHILGLTAERFERARDEAAERIRAATAKPDPAAYRGRDFSSYSPGVTYTALFGLTLVAVAMFWISAGKAIVAADLTLAGLVEDYGRLTPIWLDVALVLFLLAGDVGTLVFMAGRALLEARGVDKHILTVAAVACACGALLSNLSVTALHPEDIASIPVFGWFMAAMPPLIVLAVGLFVEKLLLNALRARAAARDAYNKALALWDAAQRDATQHPDYNARLAAAIFEQVARVSALNRRKLTEAIEADETVRERIVVREFQRHMWAWRVELPSVQPVQSLPVERVEHKALPSPVQVDVQDESRQIPPTVEQVEQPAPPPPTPEPVTPALSKALAWLEADAARLDMSIREQAAGAGVSIGTMATARARVARKDA